MNAARLRFLPMMLPLLALCSACATADLQPQTAAMVWPAPPLTTRIRFERILQGTDSFPRKSGLRERLLTAAGAPPERRGQRLQTPLGVAVTRDGATVYASDFTQGSIFVFHVSEQRVDVLPGFSGPIGLALDSADNLYVAEQVRRGVTVLDAEHRPLRFLTHESLERPTGVVLDEAHGKLYVVDSARASSLQHTVKVFALASGSLVGALGEAKGQQPGQFLFPTYAAVDAGGNVYVSDTVNGRVQKLSPEGKPIAVIGERGDAWGMFDKPKGVALDSNGNVYVVDSGWSNVQIFNPAGEVLLFFGGRGPLPGMLKNPGPIAIDGNGRIYVGDLLNQRVAVYQLVSAGAPDAGRS
ncbi:MAG: hypothetical protein HYV63_29550 [Candidatus Schekmanbacteria bacterium]|nr:hypothetical protein [Candidatus Schekmanbacteria bacterium]